MQIGSERIARRLDVVAVVGLLGWLLFDLTARTLFGSVPWPRSVVDYRIIYDASRFVVETHTYPTDNPYPYPPPAVVIHAASAVFPFGVSVALWLALTGLAAGAVYASLARTLDLGARRGHLILLPLAHLVGAYYFQWDMRSLNCNLIVLAAVTFGCGALVRGRDRWAGFWFALAVALKVLPVLVLPYLAWTRRWRAFAWAVGFSVAFWGAGPWVAFGGEGAARVYRGWAVELTRATGAELKHRHPIMISLDKATLHAFAGDPVPARALSLAVCGIWVVVGLAGAASCWGHRARDGASTLVHVSLLVLGPVAVNPYLEAYHLVPLVVPALVLLTIATDRGRSTRARGLALAGFVLGVVVLKVSSPWPLRGLLVNAQALVLCAAAVALTWRRARVLAPTAGARPATEAKGRGLLGRVTRYARVNPVTGPSGPAPEPGRAQPH
ncbi:MAG TPA: glycosyltransferase family 87 protein [Gemmata sp.]